jgi:hypothetical protein
MNLPHLERLAVLLCTAQRGESKSARCVQYGADQVQAISVTERTAQLHCNVLLLS